MGTRILKETGFFIAIVSLVMIASWISYTLSPKWNEPYIGSSIFVQTCVHAVFAYIFARIMAQTWIKKKRSATPED